MRLELINSLPVRLLMLWVMLCPSFATAETPYYRPKTFPGAMVDGTMYPPGILTHLIDSKLCIKSIEGRISCEKALKETVAEAKKCAKEPAIKVDMASKWLMVTGSFILGLAAGAALIIL